MVWLGDLLLIGRYIQADGWSMVFYLLNCAWFVFSLVRLLEQSMPPINNLNNLG